MADTTKTLLTEAMHKVREFRRQNEVLRAKVDTMELMASFLYAQAPSQSVGSEEDVAWKIERHLNTMT